jgi:rhodanese-related sulfurtransferase
MKKRYAYLVSVTTLFLVLCIAIPSMAGSVSRVTKETVKEWMGNGQAVILDARSGRDWKSSEFKIKGAHRTDPGKLDAWKSNFAKDKKLVLYCA